MESIFFIIVIGLIGGFAVGLQSPLASMISQRLGVSHDLLGVLPELRLEIFAEGDGLGGDDVHQRSALAAGEDGAVDGL